MNNHEEIQPLLSAYECGVLPLAQAKQVESHVLECDLCFSDLYEFAPAAQEIKRRHMQIPALKVKRLEVRRYLMAAVILLAALAGVLVYRSNTITEQPVVRGSDAIQLQSPAEGELVSLPVLFRWTDRSNADKYVIYIYDADGKLINQQSLDATEYLWKSERPASPGIYRWKVDALLSDGTRTASSKINELRLK
jgi:hypothetical protein